MTDLAALNWPASVTEMHVHLGGSVPLYRLWEIAVDRGIRGIGHGYEDFINTLKLEDTRIVDLESYLEMYDRVELIQSGPNAIRESIIIAVHRAYRTGGMVHLGPGGEGGFNPLFKIGRLELRLNPLKRTGAVFLKGAHAGLYDADRVILSACEVAEELEIAFRGEIQVGLIFCFGRDMTREANEILARKTRYWRNKTSKIIGLDLAGSEAANTLAAPGKLEEMQRIFDLAGEDIPRTLHVGETRNIDIETFLRSVSGLHPRRIAHPITALRAYWENGDDRGLELIKERDLVCELCVKSNLLTNAVSSLDDYRRMLEDFDRFNIPYTFSTDAPSLQGTSLAGEIMMLLENRAATVDQIMRALKVAEERSFLPKKPDSERLLP